MPSLDKTRELLEVAIINGWGSTTPIKFENAKFDNKNIDAFISVLLINYTSKNVCIGSEITKRIRHEGVLAIKIYTKQNIGSNDAYAYADQIRNIMDNISQYNLFTKASMTRKNDVPNDGWFGLIVDVPYISDEE
jgi:hypothetical protein